jgi:hypothetical protein
MPYSQHHILYPLPTELFDKILAITPDPEAWFIGQFASYLLQPNEEFSEKLKMWRQNPPLAAIHVSI